MRPTLPGILLLLSPALTLGLTGSEGGWMAAVHFILALGLLLHDGSMMVDGDALEICRQAPERIPVGAVEAVQLEVRNPTPHTLAVELRDGVPGALHPSRHRHRLRLRAGESRHVGCEVHPKRRGVFPFDGVWLELTGALGLTRRCFYRALPHTAAVIPDIRLLKAYDLQARLGFSRDPGARRVRRAGEGGELARLREYQSGDDPRFIDWKATARRRRPITREMEEERNRHITFLVDAGRWMLQPVDELLKLDHALNTTLLIAHAADRHGDISSVQVFSDRILEFVPPGRGRSHQLRLLDALHRVPTEPVETDYDLGFRFMASRLRRRSLTVLFSDFSDPISAQALTRALPVIGRRHLVLCVHILDPRIEGLVGKPSADLRVLSRRSVAESLRRERRETLDRLQADGAHVIEARADTLQARVLDRYLAIKRQGAL